MAPRPSCCASLRSFLSPPLFKALGDPTRISILVALSECRGAQTVSEIAACCPVDLSVVSRHLRTLREAGVVEATKLGKEVHYRVRYGELVAALRSLANAIEACCPPERATAAATSPRERP